MTLPVSLCVLLVSDQLSSRIVLLKIVSYCNKEKIIEAWFKSRLHGEGRSHVNLRMFLQ